MLYCKNNLYLHLYLQVLNMRLNGSKNLKS